MRLIGGEVEICNICGCRTRGLEPDFISYCNYCDFIVEGQTTWITEAEFERRLELPPKAHWLDDAKEPEELMDR